MRQTAESAIVEDWLAMRRTELVAEDGEAIQVVYPGRLNNDQGPDLLDAVLYTNGTLTKGDIEVHARSSDWQAHQHHQDPAYNRVILHVVSRRDSLPQTILQNHVAVSVLALGGDLSQSRPMEKTSFGGLPCRKAGERGTEAGVILDSAGEARFLRKASNLGEQLAREAADQVLYEAVMVGLGYSKNQQTFRELAGRLLLRTVESVAKTARSEWDARLTFQAWLFGMAGLLPSQRALASDSGYVEEVESQWQAPAPLARPPVTGWKLSRIRPGNFPTRRLAAMSELILRYGERSLMDEISEKVVTSPVGEAHQELEKLLMVNVSGYWAEHYDFGLSFRSPTLLGTERAREIVVNAVLPFIFAAGPCGLAAKALEIYQQYPQLTANALTRHMAAQLGLGPDVLSSACRQQGLIHIYKTGCSQGECRNCPLSDPVD